MAVKVKPIALDRDNVLRDLHVPAIVSFTYRNGRHSVDPGEVSHRLVMLDNTTSNSISGYDISRNGRYRKFSRRLISNAKVHGLLIPVDALGDNE